MYFKCVSVHLIFQGFPYIIQQIKDNTNLHITKNLIFSLCRNGSSHKTNIFANELISQILNIIQKNVNNSEVRALFIKIAFQSVHGNNVYVLDYTTIFQNVNFIM